MKLHWKGIATAGIRIGAAIASVFSQNITDKVFYYALWATFWVTIA